MSEEITKEVMIDLSINGTRYEGSVKITEDEDGTPHVDVTSVCDLDHFSDWAYYDGDQVARVGYLLRWEALYQGGYDTIEGEDIRTCAVTGWHAPTDELVWVDGRGEYAFPCFTYYFNEWDEYVYDTDLITRTVRDHDGDRVDFTAPEGWFQDRFYCDDCDCYIMDDDDWDSDRESCIWCNDHSVIEGYRASHEHEPILFGDYKDEKSFIGLGFELEVDCSSSNQRNNTKVAKGLCEHCGLEEDEMRYAEDGSLNYGFECISQPHTIKAFWEKRESWEKMLKYLLDNGYRSHDPATCGLHVHVSRGMFGSTKELQDVAIAKVYTFFDENWNDIVRVSRRSSFHYCNKNVLSDTEYEYIRNGLETSYKCWKKRSKFQGGHGVALNNSNRNTFEYRLGRGTLNSWSFFAWIDFVLTITKNAKRITVCKVETNDILSWLGGITESTARYIYKRGAFQKAMVALYPSIAWESDTSDNN